jgi:hypothetical protein
MSILTNWVTITHPTTKFGIATIAGKDEAVSTRAGEPGRVILKIWKNY